MVQNKNVKSLKNNKEKDVNSALNVDSNSNQKYDGQSMENTTKKRLNLGVVATIVVLIIICIASTVTSVKLGYEYSKLCGKIDHMFLGNIEIEVVKNQSSNKSVTVLNNTLTGISYSQKVKLNTSKIENPIVVRAKATLTKSDGENANIPLLETSNWELGADGYLYYLGKLSSGSNVVLCEQIKFESGILNVDNNKDMHFLTFTIESFDYQSDLALQVWVGAPQDWIDNYNNW